MKITTSKHINAPLDVTFNVFSDVQRIQDRIDGITKVEILSEVTEGVGTRWHETRMMFGREATEEMEISAFRPNHSYEVVASSHGMDYRTLFMFTKKDGGTLVEMTFSGKATSWSARLMTPLGWLMAGTMRKALEADMDDLKAVCEQLAAEAAA